MTVMNAYFENVLSDWFIECHTYSTLEIKLICYIILCSKLNDMTGACLCVHLPTVKWDGWFDLGSKAEINDSP